MNVKESGIPWVGKIPEHWEISRFKYFYCSNMGETILAQDLEDEGIPIYSATEEERYFGRIKNPKIKLKEGDFVIPARGNSIGAVKLVKELSTCTQTTIYSKQQKYSVPSYVYYFLIGFREHLFRFIQTAIPQITVSQVNDNPLLYPPIEEQKAIADFLDKKTHQIEEFITKKQKLITLLEEKKQTLINQCVTQGLDSSTSLKDSGVEWLGKIPTHWEIKKLKYISKVVLGKMLCNEKQEGYSHCYYLKSKNLQWLNVDISQVEKMWFSEYEKSIYRVKKDDLLVSEGGEVGKTCIWNDEIEECYIQNSVHKITMNSLNCPRFFLYVFFVYGKKGVFESIVNRVSIAHLVLEKLINIDFAVPPFQEQKAIAEYLDTQIAKIDLAISKIKSQINLIKEYKSTLISEAVCGRMRIN